MAEHTSGPWTYRDPMRPWVSAGQGSDSRVICELPAHASDPERVAADARLIAAAPTLLAACQEALAALEPLQHQHAADAAPHLRCVLALRAAVVRATGEEGARG